MIKNNFIKIRKKGCRKLSYFESLGYDISGDTITIKIEHLNTGSREIIDVVCDFCNKDISITYKEYIRNTSIGNKYACSKICGSEKAKETNIRNIGVINHMQLEECKERVKKTNLEKYGVEYLQQSSIIRYKSKKKTLEKYGVEHISKSEHFKEKTSKTNLEKYGVENYISSNDFREKSKETLFLNYGVYNPMQSDIIKNRCKETNLLRYGNEIYLKSDDYRNKNNITLINKWDSNNIMKSDIFRNKRFSISKNDNYIKYIENSISLLKCDNGHDFKIDIHNFAKRSESGINICTVCNPIGEQTSIKELELLEFISNNYSGHIIPRYRDGLEIDIYIPELKIGFEFNGLYWHSNKYKDKNYHIDKTNYFKDRGIKITHIWEDDWVLRRDIIKSQINNILCNNNIKIFARKCDIRIVDVRESSIFLNDNHIQGDVKSSLKLGLYNNGDLVSIMTFDHFEGRKKMEDGGWNLSRFCTKLNTNVIGGASKLLSHFIKKYEPIRIVSYADKDWSEGNLYYELGFKKVYDSKPDYKYIIDNKRVHKSRYKKSILNTKLTESKQMELNGINKLYDCGKIKFEKIL